MHLTMLIAHPGGGIGGVTVVEVVGKEGAGLVGLKDSLKIQRLVNHQQPL